MEPRNPYWAGPSDSTRDIAFALMVSDHPLPSGDRSKKKENGAGQARRHSSALERYVAAAVAI